MDAPFLTDGQYAGLLAVVGGGLAGIAAAVRWGLGRGAKAFDDMAASFRALTDRHQSTQEKLIELASEVREGRADIGEIKAAVISALAEPSTRRSKVHRAATPPLGTRRATTDSDR